MGAYEYAIGRLHAKQMAADYRKNKRPIYKSEIMANKKSEWPLIAPSFCIKGLEEYIGRLSPLLNIIPEVLQFMKDAKHEKKEYQSYLIKIVEDSFQKVNEVRNSTID